MFTMSALLLLTLIITSTQSSIFNKHGKPHVSKVNYHDIQEYLYDNNDKSIYEYNYNQLLYHANFWSDLLEWYESHHYNDITPHDTPISQSKSSHLHTLPHSQSTHLHNTPKHKKNYRRYNTKGVSVQKTFASRLIDLSTSKNKDGIAAISPVTHTKTYGSNT
eukprot:244409_1